MDVDEMVRTSPEWEALWTLLGVYFNQDSPDIYGEPWEAAAAYRRAAGPGRATSAASAARSLVAGFTDEADVEAAAVRMGLEYHPPSDGYTYRAWLAALAAFLETGKHPEG